MITHDSCAKVITLAGKPVTRTFPPENNSSRHRSDWLVGNATAQPSVIDTFSLTNTSTYTGQTTMNNYVYQTTVAYTSGYLQNSSDGINHGDSVSVNGLPAIDGLVALMTVRILSRPAASRYVLI
jgi:hypothetical protein